MNELIRINPDGRTTSKELYEFLELNPTQYSRWCKMNIEDNEFAEEGTDYGLLDMNVENQTTGRPSLNYWLSISFAKKLCMMSKTERGEQARNYFIEVERRFNAPAPLPQMTQTQIVAALAQNAADQEQKLLAIEARQVETDLRSDKLERRLELVKDVLAKPAEENWRKSINDAMAKIVDASGMDYSTVKSESYQQLEGRAGCNLGIRVKNARDRLAESGATKTKINAFCKLDAIEQEQRLKEIYASIVREMTIRYVA